MTENDAARGSLSPTLHRRCLLAGGAGAAAATVLAGCGGGGGSPTSTELGAAADVAVGAGVIYPEQQVVVTQPTEGEFRAFDTTCTHAGCPVASVSETINCDCHGSQFSIEDGSVVGGPAPEPLAPKNVTVEGGTITLT